MLSETQRDVLRRLAAGHLLVRHRWRERTRRYQWGLQYGSCEQPSTIRVLEDAGFIAWEEFAHSYGPRAVLTDAGRAALQETSDAE
jgi:hypothetical protein